MDKHLHIISLDVPYPADYGGVIDIFYKIKTLHQLGIKIHLHCFTKKRESQSELNKYCQSVNYYQRKNIRGFSLTTPYIVKSRSNLQLLQNLQKDNYPILLEGIHTTYFLKKLKNRKTVIRLHNVEFEYYNQLAKNETNIFKQKYYLNECKLLFKYEKKLSIQTFFAAISHTDIELYKSKFSAKNLFLIPAFIPFTEVESKSGLGNYCLYHGNLAINENQIAAIWLAKNIFANSKIPFIVAGKNSSKKFLKILQQFSNIKLISNPTETEMQNLIANAQINVLPSFNNTGIKLKLLNALFNGRHCVVNAQTVYGSGLQSICTISNNIASFKKDIENLFTIPFTDKQKQQRQSLLQIIYNNNNNATQLIKRLY